jgi:signal transduction histidine kinase
VQHVERALAASIGASSARVVLTHALQRKGLEVDEVAELLDETSQELRFSRQLLQATMENVTQGISVVDAQLRSWPGIAATWSCSDIRTGWSRSAARWSTCCAGTRARRARAGRPGAQVEKRLAHLRAGTAYTFQRVRRNGQVYSIHGQPMAGGGFVTTYTDITEFKRHEQALLEAKQGLEERVAHRTRELSASLEAQRLAKQEAEAANTSKTRFFAAASHDLLQPLNAARLFVSALESQARAHPEFAGIGQPHRCLDARRRRTAQRPARQRAARQRRAQAGYQQLSDHRPARGAAPPICTARAGAAPAAAHRRLPRSGAQRSLLLRRIIQNYLSNGLRYTERGGVVVGCRRRGGELEIAVYDTGPGIAAHQRQAMYAEFSRLEHDSPWGEKGLGLGLSICDRLARSCSIRCRSTATRAAARCSACACARCRRAARTQRRPARLPAAGSRRPATACGFCASTMTRHSRWDGGAARDSGAYRC